MDVLCVGHAAWDISVFVDGYPAENSKCEIHAMLECGGGPAANAAYLLSKWGVSCGIAASIGADAYGNRIADEFLAVGAEHRLAGSRSGRRDSGVGHLGEPAQWKPHHHQSQGRRPRSAT